MVIKNTKSNCQYNPKIIPYYLTGRNYRTIKKYIEQDDFNSKEHKVKRPNKSDVLRPIINKWLTEDKFRYHKQKHTAKRIYDRLKEEYPDLLKVSERTVRRIVKEEGEKVYGADNAYLKLEHPGGEAQVDFGCFKAYENGTLKDFHMLVLSFVAQRTRDERGVVKPTDFIVRVRFATHYAFDIKLCNPNSGHEKGNVENKVGIIRRNIFVPEPTIKDLDEFNQKLLEKCLEANKELHYRHKVPIKDLFEAEKTLMIPVNKVVFDTANYENRKVNKYGLVEYSGCRYSVSPKYVGEFERGQESINYIDFIDIIKLRPNALKYLSIYSLLPTSWQDYLKSLDFKF